MPPLITSAQRAAFNSMNGHGKLCLCHHNQTAHLNHATQLLREFPTPAFQDLEYMHAISDWAGKMYHSGNN